VFAYLRQINGNYTQALTFLASLMTAALILPILVRPPRNRNVVAAADVPAQFPVEALPTNTIDD
jgi:hypothetical protein